MAKTIASQRILSVERSPFYSIMDLVARVDNAHHGGMERRLASGGNEDFVLKTVFNIGFTANFIGKKPSQFGDAAVGSVMRRALIEGFLRGPYDMGRCLEIGLTEVKMEAIRPLGCEGLRYYLRRSV